MACHPTIKIYRIGRIILHYRLLGLGRNSMSHPKDGFIMYFVVLLVLTVMGTTFALANRTTSGLAGQMRQSALRAAEFATENGLKRTITDMNQPANRYLWAYDVQWWPTLGNDVYPRNACKFATEPPNFNTNGAELFPSDTWSYQPTGSIKNIFQNITDRQTTNYQESWIKGFVYQVLAVTLKDQNHNIIGQDQFHTISTTNPSFVELRVRGTYNANVAFNQCYQGLDTDANIQSARCRNFNSRDNQANNLFDHDVNVDITREYKLVPFCCKTGFLYRKTGTTVANENYGSVAATNECTGTNPQDKTGIEKVGWIIVGPSNTGIFRSSLQ